MAFEDGLHDTKNYVLGRGLVFFSPLGAGDVPTRFRDLGNCTSVSFSIDTQTQQHFSSRAGLRVSDLSVITEQSITITVVLDSINFQNLALALSGTVNASTLLSNDDDVTDDGTDGAATGNNVLTITEYGRWYPIFKDAITGSGGSMHKWIQGIRTPTSINGQNNATYTATPGYGMVIDRGAGMIYVPEGSTAPLNTPMDVVLPGWDGISGNPKTSFKEVRALTVSSLKGALLIKQLNPADASQAVMYHVHKVALSPSGDMELITEDSFQTLTLTGTLESSVLADPVSPYITIRTNPIARDNPPG